MAERTTLVEQSVDRVQDAVRSLDREFRKLQRRFRTRAKDLERRIDGQRKDIERRIGDQRKSLEKQAQKQFKELRKLSVVKRAEEIGTDAAKQLESSVESVLGAFQIASKQDLERVDKKLTQINKRLKEIESSTGLAA